MDRLLKTGGLIVFDDLDWTYKASPALKKTDAVQLMPQDERDTPQIRKIYELLVIPHPSYGEFVEKDGWAYARKVSQESSAQLGDTHKHVVYEKEYVGLLKMLKRLAR